MLYMASAGVRWVEFFASMELWNGYVDLKKSPEPPSSRGEKQMCLILILGKNRRLSLSLIEIIHSGNWVWVQFMLS